MAGLFGSITIKGNRLTEFASQTSTVGIPIPFGFGKFPCEGNIIFAPMPPKEHVKKKKQGKGGVKTEEYSYTLSYAIAFCEGPIYGFWTIKRNGKVVWTQDPDASVDDKAYAAKWAQKATFYFGTETQMPDSTIESYKGAGKVSAHRGIAYIVVEDDDVTDNGGAVPTYEAICIGNGIAYATSPPYPYIFGDGMGASASNVDGEFKTLIVESTYTEKLEIAASLTYGFIGPALQELGTKEALEVNATLQAGEIKSILVPYTTKENLEVAATLQSGEIKVILVTPEPTKEALSVSATLISGVFE
ncbi:putative tail protein [Xanthomonas phage Pfeifenkraut]|uniref:Tail protein n=1 Tax=Xanthomonas phage Pfeifenkraut TaxID=2939132 RepID=A0A9E7J568_9CAUD|nr:putative tail protein [Xanthomonas phage Pfeifenkraut]URA06910.1 putative tail protein [Xanthomonas phage Pfeifenkraut]